jgi:hypothetical protein
MMVFDVSSKCIRAFTETGWGKCFSGKTPNDMPPGSINCSGPTLLIEVTNPVTGRIWMDRNLGAQQEASSSNDIAAYGDLFQWGRFSDGHQCRNSDTTSVLATSERPPHPFFITTNAAPNNWLSYRSDTLWGPQNGAQNNPCPYGYRLPTEAELINEVASWSSTDTAGAIQSILKLPAAGRRNGGNGSLAFEGSQGFYWTLDISGNQAKVLRIGQLDAVVENLTRSTGASVRCIKVNL